MGERPSFDPESAEKKSGAVHSVVSKDGTHRVDIIQEGRHRFVVSQDGTSWDQQFLAVKYLSLSEDGQHAAAVVEDLDGETVAVDGKKWTAHFDHVSRPALSHDARTVAATAIDDEDNVRVIVNDNPWSQSFWSVRELAVSPEGDAVVAITEDKMQKKHIFNNGNPVTNGRSDQAYDLYFSADGKRWAARVTGYESESNETHKDGYLTEQGFQESEPNWYYAED